MNNKELIDFAPELAPLFEELDHLDVKTAVSPTDLRHFIATALSYQPGWMKALYAIRWGFVRLLGMKQEGLGHPMRIQPQDVSFLLGDWVTFFEVARAKEDRYWFAAAEESHLIAYLGVVQDDRLPQRRFHVATLVRYKRWTGWVYFNVIRPFHHIVVNSMIRAAVRDGVMEEGVRE